VLAALLGAPGGGLEEGEEEYERAYKRDVGFDIYDEDGEYYEEGGYYCGEGPWDGEEIYVIPAGGAVLLIGIEKRYGDVGSAADCRRAQNDVLVIKRERGRWLAEVAGGVAELERGVSVNIGGATVPLTYVIEKICSFVKGSEFREDLEFCGEGE
jgi:hypothetical protein